MTEKKEATSKYIVLTPVDHDGVRYEIGEEIDLTDKQAKVLINLPSPAIVAPSSVLAKQASAALDEQMKTRLANDVTQRATQAADQVANAEMEKEAKRSVAMSAIEEAKQAEERAEVVKERAGEVADDLKAEVKSAKLDADAVPAVQVVADAAKAKAKK